MSKTAGELVADAKSQIENLTVEQFAAEVEAGTAIIVDLREAEELEASGHVPGSVHVTRGMLEFRADPTSPYHHAGFDPTARTVLYCASGGRSALAAAALGELGYTDVAHLDGGFKAWSEDARAVEKI